MLPRKIIVVGSEIHIKHMNTVCVQKVIIFYINPVVIIVTTGI